MYYYCTVREIVCGQLQDDEGDTVNHMIRRWSEITVSMATVTRLIHVIAALLIRVYLQIIITDTVCVADANVLEL